LPTIATAAGFGDPLVWTPSAVRAEVEKTRTYYRLIDADMGNPLSPPQLRRTWRALVDEFDLWVESEPSTWSGATVGTAREYQRRAEKFRERLVAFYASDLYANTQVPVLSAPTRAGAPAPPKPVKPGFPWKTAFVVAGLLGTLGAGVYFSSRYVPARKAARA